MLHLNIEWLTVRNNIEKGLTCLVDLRSEKEFSLGAVPGAVNLPLLNNQERHEIGCLYKQSGKQSAVHRGLELFAKRSEKFFDQISQLAENRSDIVVYCWRGGMRSRLVGQWLAASGFDVSVLSGGYKGFRKTVLREMSELSRHPKVVLNGRTGSGKTLFLRDCMSRQLPGIDLEGLARHRGSAFGAMGWSEPSPTQQNFENELVSEYQNVKHAPKILLEIEGVIGPVSLSNEMRDSVRRSPMVYVEREMEDRIDLLCKIYSASWQEKEIQESLEALEMLRKFFSKEDIERMQSQLRTGELRSVIKTLLEQRYDKAYDKSLSRHQNQMLNSFNLSTNYEDAVSYIKKILE